MELERIAEILGNTEGKRYTLIRHIADASSIAKSIKDYAIELWEMLPEGNKELVMKADYRGLITEEHLKETREKAEEVFIKELFLRLKSVGKTC